MNILHPSVGKGQTSVLIILDLCSQSSALKLFESFLERYAQWAVTGNCTSTAGILKLCGQLQKPRTVEMTFTPNITLFTQLLCDTSTPPYPCFIWTVSSLATDDWHLFVYPEPSTIKDFVGSPLYNLTNTLSICRVSKVSILLQIIFNSYMEKLAETELNLVPTICRK